MNIMKRIYYFFFLLFLCSIPSFAGDLVPHLVVITKDQVKTMYSMADNPKVTFTATDLCVKYKDVTTTYPFDFVHKFIFENLEVDTPVSDMTDVIYIEPQTATIGTQFVLPIKLRNATDAAGYEFLLTLPEGIEVAKDESDDYIFSRTSRHKDSHNVQISANNTNGVYKVLYYSMDTNVLAGDGVVINITLNASSELVKGKYAVKISNALYTTPTAVSVDLEPVTTTLTLIDNQKGDANDDGTVSVADVVSIISYILGENLSDFNTAAADVNGDGKVTVADAVEVIKILVGGPNSAN